MQVFECSDYFYRIAFEFISKDDISYMFPIHTNMYEAALYIITIMCDVKFMQDFVITSNDFSVITYCTYSKSRELLVFAEIVCVSKAIVGWLYGLCDWVVGEIMRAKCIK